MTSCETSVYTKVHPTYIKRHFLLYPITLLRVISVCSVLSYTINSGMFGTLVSTYLLSGALINKNKLTCIDS